MIEPILRRPPLQVYTNQGLTQEWFYYPKPRIAVSVQERLHAAARRTDSWVSAMPQFLLKEGMAAPYSALPTPHMYREAMWHCLARPVQAVTYWNLWSVMTQQTNALDQAGMDAIFGASATEADINSRYALDPTLKKYSLFVPGLRDEVARLHRETLHPLGALLPQWTNRPRRIAIYASLAGELFSEVRWPLNDNPLIKGVDTQSQPYDYIYDEDFDASGTCLDAYDLVVIPENSGLYAPAKEPLRALLARGGKVLVDDYWKTTLPGVTQLKWRGTAAEKASSDAAVLAACAAVRRQADCNGTGAKVALNLLQHAGANYVVAVNTRRQVGPHFGRFGRVLEDGVAQTATLVLDPALGSVAYAIPEGVQIPLAAANGRLAADLDLPPAGGRMLVLLPRPIAKISLNIDGSRLGRDGGDVTLEAVLTDAQNQVVPGGIPLRCDIRDPTGAMSDLSRYAMFSGGRWTLTAIIPANAPMGTWTATVRDLAAGRTATVELLFAAIDITPPATPAAPTSSNLSSATPTLSGTTEAGAIIRIYDDATLLGTVTADGSGAWTWTVSPSLPVGSHALTVIATDMAGNASAASPATVVTVASVGGGGDSVQIGGGGGGGCGLGGGSAVLLLAVAAMLGLRSRRAASL